MKDFRTSAELFLQQWCDPDREVDGERPKYRDTDQGFVAQFRGDFTCDQLARFCVCYAVSRTIPGNDPTHRKYQPFADMLKRHRHTPITQETMPRFVVERVDEMARHYGRQILSAVTKAFWMVRQQPIVIFDSYARTALGRLGLSPGVGYPEYVESWLRLSRRSNKELSDALSWLPDSPASKSLERRGIATVDQVHKWAEEPWFRDRVIDMYLWFAGG